MWSLGDDEPQHARQSPMPEESAVASLPWRRETEAEPEASHMVQTVSGHSLPQTGEVPHSGTVQSNPASAMHNVVSLSNLTNRTDSHCTEKNLNDFNVDEEPIVSPGKFENSDEPILSPRKFSLTEEDDKFSTVCSLGESETGGDCSLPPPWRSIPSIPEVGPPVRSPSASFEMDSLVPHPSNHSLRLSEAESRHSEPYPCLHHVIEVPHCRPSECDLLPFGTRVELDLEEENLDCWERVQHWLDRNEEYLVGGHYDPPESPFMDDYSHAMAVAAADRILDLHGLDIHHDMVLAKKTLRRHASHDTLPRRASHDALHPLSHGSPPNYHHHHILHHDWAPALPSHALYQRQMSTSSIGGVSSRSPSHDEHEHFPFPCCSPHMHQCRQKHYDDRTSVSDAFS